MFTRSVKAFAWRALSLPIGVVLTDHVGFAVSPVDGQDAWVCAPTSAGGFTVWATQNAAATWQQMGTLAPVTPEPVDTCGLLADQNDPRALVAEFVWGSGEAGTLRSMTLASSDAGAHWHRLPGTVQTMEIGTQAGITYAILMDTSATPNQQMPGVAISTDDLRSWHLARPPGLAPHDSFFQFWLVPTGITLLGATYQGTLWQTADAGTTWARVNTPDTQTSLGAWLPQQHRWELCGWVVTPALRLQCSLDLGQTWQTHPLLSFTTSCATCDKGKPYSFTQPCFPDTLTPDGSLLAFCPIGDGSDQPAPCAVYRLALGAAAWSQYGTSPAGLVTVPATGPVWSVNPQQGTLMTAMLPW
ncbi:MAG TPA: hypothetical protein VGN32_17670 [Ktedonobacterales bacterium]|nr:hypothetical protein [Ktedonobacterales bacterium]